MPGHRAANVVLSIFLTERASTKLGHYLFGSLGHLEARDTQCNAAVDWVSCYCAQLPELCITDQVHPMSVAARWQEAYLGAAMGPLTDGAQTFPLLPPSIFQVVVGSAPYGKTFLNQAKVPKMIRRCNLALGDYHTVPNQNRR